VVKRTLEALEQDPGRSELHALLEKQGELTSKDIFEVAAKGDALAAKIVEDTAFYLGVGAMNMMHMIDPDLVAFSGGMVAAGEGFLERIRHHVKELAFPVPAQKTKICYAQLGSDAGFIGAAACARQLFKKKRS
jgi:glucokinase